MTLNTRTFRFKQKIGKINAIQLKTRDHADHAGLSLQLLPLKTLLHSSSIRRRMISTSQNNNLLTAQEEKEMVDAMEVG